MNRNPLTLLLLAALSLAANVPGNSADTHAPARFLVLGPLPAPRSLFAQGQEETDLPPEALDPREGGRVAWLGKSAAWTVADAPGGRAALTSGPDQVAYLATYLENPRWQNLAFRLESSGPATLHLNETLLTRFPDTKGRAIRACPRGGYLVLIRTTSPKAGETWSVTLSVAAEGVTRPETPTFSLDPTRPPARFEEVEALPRPGPMVLSQDGTLLALFLEGELQVRSLPENRLVGRLPAGSAAHMAFLGKDRLAFLSGNDLSIWHFDSGETKTWLTGMETASNLRWNARGDRLFWLESPKRPKPDPVERRVNLRQGIQDWNPNCRIWTADLDQGLKRPITATADFHLTEFDLSPDGTKIVLVRKVPVSRRPWFAGEIWVLDSVTLAGNRVATLRTGFEVWPSSPRFSPDGGRVLFIAPPAEIPDAVRSATRPTLAPPEVVESHGEHNVFNPDLFVLNLGDGRLERITAAFDPGVVWHDGEGPWWDPDGKRIHFLAMAGRRRAFFSADLSGESPTFRAWKSGPVVASRPAPAAGAGRVAFLSGGFTRPPYLAWLDPTLAEPKQLLDPAAEARARWRLVEPLDFAFLNQAGKRIDGWVYKPPAPPDHKLPLIVYYYAGAVGTREGFNWTHQFLAANGYAVYVLNPRGASDYGREFADSHVNDWGARATQDIIEGLDRILQADPTLDPRRVGCYGGSYGGFTTMDLLTKSDKLAAAVSLFGISNIASYWGAGTWGWTYGDTALARSYPWNRPDIFVGRSPLFNADRIRTPLLLLHGLADTNVPHVESDQMFTALQVLGRTAEYVTFAGEDHGLSGKTENRNEHRRMLLEWFDRYLKDQPEAWRARWKESGERTKTR